MTDRELMQRALDALKVMRPACFAETTLKAADTSIVALSDRLAQPEKKGEWQYVQKLNAFRYPSYGLMGGDEFVSKDSIKRNVT